MKDKRIWIVIGHILVIGTGVTHYTKHYVNSQGAAVMVETLAEAEETVVSSLVPALGQLGIETGEADADIAAGRAAPATPAERRMTEDAGPGNAASGNTTSGDAGPGSTGHGNTAYAAAPVVEATGAFSSDHAAPTMADAVEETMASDAAGFTGAVEGAAVSETASERDMPTSPLTGTRTRGYKANRIVDYHKCLEDLDT